MEKEEKGNMNMTVGVVLTVAVAILLLVAMIPAMMPAGEGGDDGPAPYVTSVEITSNGSTHDDKIQTINFYQDATLLGYVKASYPWNESYVYEGKLSLYGWDYDEVNNISVYPTGDGTLKIDFLYTLDEFIHGVEEFIDNPLIIGSKESPEDETPIFSEGTVVGPNGTPNIYVLLWESLFLNKEYDMGFDPENPPGSGSSGGVDTNTVLIGAIISLMFISIAMVAVRSFRA